MSPELAHLVCKVRRTTRPGAHEGVRRQVPRGFPVFSCRGGRCGPAVTAGVQPPLPAAGLPLRPRPGLSRRRSSACAAARPGAPAGRDPGEQGFAGDREHRQPPRVAQARPHAEDHPHDRESKVNKGVPRSLASRGRRGGRRHLYATLAQQVLLPLDVLFRLGPGRRFGTKAPRHQPEPSSACPRGQGPLPAADGPVPGPDGSLGTNGDDRGHPFERPRGPGPVQNGHEGHPPQLGPAVIMSHPGIVAQAAPACQAPGLPPPVSCPVEDCEGTAL